ncbi:DUF2187 domain-containing protein [Bombilactobacillus thymidiniphilus]|uniref:DUF2187 domain-containing protein n=1 Tax=Bombilactobacillus thymidiniphilus TaxID=2923363 RepID=A0ABY4PF17_9LACO|nr:DUF2187 domain-containing protein [Bombilactobacillus thymidiniphilus]UQS84142.1 DUF2187 domain-containing protein [Bombilactobacillus thymidiniphilus]
MKLSSIKIGDQLRGRVTEDLEYPFVGTVEKIYTNSVLLAITDYDQQDADNVAELNQKIVVAADSLTKVGK